MSSIAQPPLLWITGLSGVGKTQLATHLLQRSQALGLPVAHVDGDRLRQQQILQPDSAEHFTVEARQRRARVIADYADAQLQAGRAVIVSTISLFHQIQTANRQRWPRYAEIWLQCAPETLIQRYPERYAVTHSNYVGAGQAAEYPRQAELVLIQEFNHDCEHQHQQQAWRLWMQLVAGWREALPA